MTTETRQQRTLPTPTTEQGLSTHLHRSHGGGHAYGRWTLSALENQHAYLHDCCGGTCGNHVHEPASE